MLFNWICWSCHCIVKKHLNVLCFFLLHQRSVRESCERIGSFLHEVCKAEEETGRWCNVLLHDVLLTFETDYFVAHYHTCRLITLLHSQSNSVFCNAVLVYHATLLPSLLLFLNSPCQVVYLYCRSKNYSSKHW